MSLDTRIRYRRCTRDEVTLQTRGRRVRKATLIGLSSPLCLRGRTPGATAEGFQRHAHCDDRSKGELFRSIEYANIVDQRSEMGHMIERDRNRDDGEQTPLRWDHLRAPTDTTLPLLLVYYLVPLCRPDDEETTPKR